MIGCAPRDFCPNLSPYIKQMTYRRHIIGHAHITLLVLAAALSWPSLSYAVAGSLRPIEPIFDFGEVGIDYDLHHPFRLVNMGTVPIKIDSAIVTCDCSYVQLLDSVAQPGDTLTIFLKFNTKDYYGKTSKAIHVYTNENKFTQFDIFYLSTVGQWFYNLKPTPLNAFFLAAHTEKTITLANPLVEGLTLSAICHYDTLYTVTPLQNEADEGEKIEITVTPKPGLKAGTYVSNFRLGFTIPGAVDTLFMSVPVKIVRY